MAIEKVLREVAYVPKLDILTAQIPPLQSIEERTESAISAITAKSSGKSFQSDRPFHGLFSSILVVSIVNCHFCRAA